ncbi:MAG: dTDP-4-dehydrorhamnose reductase [Bacteroidetes bacterium GWF2_42_66]|nr:MAG: dTDP-4-dehydrorhamnose reductase [Bacteroidetes bacterium GWA2_42_15]OFY02703.1 MAG: dTDP-4-dehydrorhamnose reductase [Bacteroidetes bacterium GWE2_42_39]OFY43902.1 MAG: dTDP-4-dehydrorhamnose reductase [Bacteroidetes bacterium GWF2_42_66]HBL77273.1 dTDP-4-dehydrorhamnose reductase [Prolixibacteraceae bacterium]HCR90650.1 dTDP-4-dehydrorhamnose reductase [Prolixibacteraceae bacterium]
MTKLLITGANGQLGSEIKKIAGQFSNLEFLFTDVAELDITNPGKVAAFLSESKPDFLVNCAAYTAVDKAESDEETALLINATAVSILAEQSAKINCKIVHISTDYVFDGKASQPYTEDASVNPQSAYGRTKLEGELLCMKNNPQSIIIRTAWLYSAFGNNFVKTMLRLGRERDELRIVADQVGSPTNAADLATAILTIISSVATGEKTFETGIYHYSNEGVTSWYDFTVAIVETAGLSCKVVPITTAEYPSATPRPAYSVMDKSKIKRIFGLEIPHWKESLNKYFSE